MNKLGRNKRNWLVRQGCLFINEGEKESEVTTIVTSEQEYVGLADLGGLDDSVNFIFKNRLTNLMSVSRAAGLTLSKTGCNAVCIGFNEREQAWYGFTHRGHGKFYIGYEVEKGSMLDYGNHRYPFKVKTLEEAKELAIQIAYYLN